MSLPSNETAKPNTENWVDRFLAGVQSTEPVSGFTHNYYRYPARFSPQFARAAIEAFSKPGDVILDPFMGGATTLVEARTLGRHAVGSDINSLSVFLAKVKTTALNDNDLARIENWLFDLPEHLNLHRPAIRAEWWQAAGYQRNLPWPTRKTIELALAQLHQLPCSRQQRFARCLLLKAGQWALDCRERIPSAEEFRRELFKFLEIFVDGMREYRQAVQDNPPPGPKKAISIAVHRAASALPAEPAFKRLPKKPTLVVTSPPYPGVYVLYHRWKVKGRKEIPGALLGRRLFGWSGCRLTTVLVDRKAARAYKRISPAFVSPSPGCGKSSTPARWLSRWWLFPSLTGSFPASLRQ
jgi:hypothetical protein